MLNLSHKLLWQTKAGSTRSIHRGKLEESILLVQWKWSRDEVVNASYAVTYKI